MDPLPVSSEASTDQALRLMEIADRLSAKILGRIQRTDTEDTAARLRAYAILCDLAARLAAERERYGGAGTPVIQQIGTAVYGDPLSDPDIEAALELDGYGGDCADTPGPR